MRESSAVDTLQTINRGFTVISGEGSNEPPSAERTSKTLATGFGGPAAPPAVARHKSTSSAVDTLQTNSRGFNTNSGGQLRRASGAVCLEPPHAERTSKTLATGFVGPAVPPAIAGYDRESSTVDTLLTINWRFNAISGGGSNVNSGGLSRSASVAIDLEPPHAERTSKKITTGFAGPPAVPPAIEGFDR